MAVVSNIKAQANKLFSTAKNSNITKGARSLLYEDNLISKSQANVLNNINSSITPSQNSINAIRGELGDKAGDIAKGNAEMIQKVGLDGISRGKGGIEGIQRNTILNSAEGMAINHQKPINESLASSLVTKSAKQIDRTLAIRTPMAAAKEYYGSPIAGAIGSIKNKDEFIGHASKAGARLGVTAGALAGTKSITNSLRNTGVRGDDGER